MLIFENNFLHTLKLSLISSEIIYKSKYFILLILLLKSSFFQKILIFHPQKLWPKNLVQGIKKMLL